MNHCMIVVPPSPPRSFSVNLFSGRYSFCCNPSILLLRAITEEAKDVRECRASGGGQRVIFNLYLVAYEKPRRSSRFDKSIDYSDAGTFLACLCASAVVV